MYTYLHLNMANLRQRKYGIIIQKIRSRFAFKDKIPFDSNSSRYVLGDLDKSLKVTSAAKAFT